MLYKTLILPVLLYGAEAWTLLSTDIVALRVFERKVLRKIFSPVWVGHDELHNDMDVLQRINIQRLHWLGHVVHMEEDVPARRVFAEVGEQNDFGSTKSRKPCHRMVWPSGLGAQEPEAPGRMFCVRPKSVIRVDMAI